MGEERECGEVGDYRRQLIKWERYKKKRSFPFRAIKWGERTQSTWKILEGFFPSHTVTQRSYHLTHSDLRGGFKESSNHSFEENKVSEKERERVGARKRVIPWRNSSVRAMNRILACFLFYWWWWNGFSVMVVEDEPKWGDT